MKITKIDKSKVNLVTYKSQNTIRRGKDVRGGFDQIVMATDQDLD